MLMIDQSSAADTWVSLGKYLFLNDDRNYVYLGDSTGTAGEIIAFDAVKWESADQQELDLTADYRTGMPDYDITFTAVSGLPEGEYDHIWDFGDGSTAQGKTVMHHYRNEGMYSVKLSVRAGNAEISVLKENYIMIIRNLSGDFDLINPDSMEVVNTQTPLLFWEPVRKYGKIPHLYWRDP
ncbi:MAG: PKD domain-containing protein [Candidatus Marinimicrobia bacterium]|nr:PKD domain-containing protein [Candidatus Neomarinimicrobiota bacterium]